MTKAIYSSDGIVRFTGHWNRQEEKVRMMSSYDQYFIYKALKLPEYDITTMDKNLFY
jgi:hypothetical protein